MIEDTKTILDNQRNGFTFYRSFYESLEHLPTNQQVKIYNAICNYALNNVEPNLTSNLKSIFILIKPNIDSAIKRADNGKKGGRPKTKTKPNNNQNKPNKNQSKPKANQSDSDNIIEKEKEEDKDIDKEIDKELDKNKDKDTSKNFGKFSNVCLNDKQFNQLIFEFGEETTNKTIDELSVYMASKGKTYKNHYATLIGFIKRNQERREQEQQQKPVAKNKNFSPETERMAESLGLMGGEDEQ